MSTVDRRRQLTWTRRERRLDGYFHPPRKRQHDTRTSTSISFDGIVVVSPLLRAKRSRRGREPIYIFVYPDKAKY